MTEINAYNLCLQAIGQARISSINTYDPDVAEIQNHLDEVTREYLTRGWSFNTDTVTLSVDQATSKVPVSGYLAYYLPSQYSNLVSRRVEGSTISYLWNTEENEWHAEAISNVPVVVDLVWDSIPAEVQDAIAYAAAARFALQVKGLIPQVQYYETKAYNHLGNAEMTYMKTDYHKSTGLYKLLAYYNN